jgi:hypothetical protein
LVLVLASKKEVGQAEPQNGPMYHVFIKRPRSTCPYGQAALGEEQVPLRVPMIQQPVRIEERSQDHEAAAYVFDRNRRSLIC